MANDDFLVPSDVDLSTLCGIDQDVAHKGSLLRAFACLSMAAYLYLFWMYFVVKTPVLKRHPTRLAIYGCIIEMGYFQQYLWLPTVGRDYLYNDDAVSEPYYCTSSKAASWWAFVTQFCTIGVQLCFLIISVDLRLAYTNPFSSFKHNKMYFAAFVILGSLLTALCLLAMGPRVYGYDEHGIVWIQDSRAHLAMNWPKFILYYLIVMCIYIYSLWANFQFYRSSEKGLSVTISNRLSIMQRSKRFVLGHISVDMFILALEFLSFVSAGDEGILLALPAYLQALRGVLGLLVVLYSNSEDITWQSMNPFQFVSSLTADKNMVEKVALEGLLQQPHLNTALRAEILYFSTQGMMFAARNFERSGGLYGDSVEYNDEEVGGHSAPRTGDGTTDMYEFEEHPTQGIRPSLVVDETNGVRATAANSARQTRQAAAGSASGAGGDHAGPALSAFLRAQDERVQAEREEAFLESVAYFGLPRESISFRGADVRHNSSSAAHSPYTSKAPRPASTMAANTAHNARSSLSPSVHIDTRNPLAAAANGSGGVRGSEVEMRATGGQREESRDTVSTQATVKWHSAQDVEYNMGRADSVANNRRDSWYRVSRTSALKLKDDRLASADSDFSGRSHSSSAVALMKRTLHSVLSNAQSMFNPAFKEFRFKDFSPGHFARVREMCSLTAGEYSRSFEATCKETFSEGRSGAFMFFSADQRCIAKSTSKAELQSLLKLMPEYVEYLTTHPNSLLTRFIGAHCITMYGVELYFVVMLNCFPPHRLSERYDLKGSWVNRHALTKTEFKGGNKKKTAVKSPMLYLDNDLQHKLSLQPGIAHQVAEQIFKDVEFLSSHKKMDYSLLVGVKRERFEVVSASALAGGGDPSAAEFRESRMTISVKNGRITDCSVGVGVGVSAESYRPPGIPAGSAASAPVKAGDGKALRVVSRAEDEHIDPEDDGGLHTHYVEGPAKYYLGIIDVLQEWTLSKQLERAAKVFLYRYDPDGISAMNPADYAKRFLRKCVLETFEGLEEARPSFASGLSQATDSASASNGGSAAE